MAIDAANSITSAPSPVQSFTALPLSQAETVAQQLGIVLWPAKVPPGSVGHATMGDNWQIQTLHYLPGNVFFQSPDAEMLRMRLTKTSNAEIALLNGGAPPLMEPPAG